MSVRLTTTRRAKLNEHAREVIVFPELQEAETRAHKTLWEAIKTELANWIAPSEIEVLHKYGGLNSVDCIVFALPGTPVAEPGQAPMPKTVTFGLLPRDATALKSRYYRAPSAGSWAVDIPSSWLVLRNGGGNLPNVINDSLIPLVLAWQEALQAHTEARDKGLLDLRALFYHKSTLKAVIDAWAPAADIAEALGAAPKLDKTALARIKNLKTTAPSA